MIELSLNKLQKYYGGTMILEDITFDIQTAEKVGIVGGNGGVAFTQPFKIIGSNSVS